MPGAAGTAARRHERAIYFTSSGTRSAGGVLRLRKPRKKPAE